MAHGRDVLTSVPVEVGGDEFPDAGIQQPVHRLREGAISLAGEYHQAAPGDTRRGQEVPPAIPGHIGGGKLSRWAATR